MDINELLKTPLELSEITEFLNEKVKNHACNSCLQNNWSIMHDPHLDFGIVGQPRDGSFNMPPPFAPTVMVICNNCGFIKMFAKTTLLNWKVNKSKVKPNA